MTIRMRLALLFARLLGFHGSSFAPRGFVWTPSGFVEAQRLTKTELFELGATIEDVECVRCARMRKTS